MKGVILAGGYGTRFLPVTKTIPKEMLPLVDRPAIDFIVEEFIKSGIKDILIVTSRRKKSLEDYFDREIELEVNIEDQRKLKKLNVISDEYDDANIFFIRQQEMKGTGHGVLICKSFCSSPFVLAFPDDIVLSETPLAKQLIDRYNESSKSVLSVLDYSGEDVSRYGVIDPDTTENNGAINVKGIVEKPSPGTEPSKLISIGRYLFTPEIFPLLEEDYEKNKEGEFYLTDAINRLAKQKQVIAHKFSGNRYDTGEPLGYLKTLTEYALSRDDLKDEYLDYLKEIVK